VVGESPFSTIQRIRTKLHGAWLRHTYPFAEFGTGVSVHSSCDIWRSMSRQIRIGDNVYLAPEVWIDVASVSDKCGVESVCQWCVGLVSGGGLLVGFAVSVGLDSVSLGQLELLRRWMGMAAGRPVCWARKPAEGICGEFGQVFQCSETTASPDPWRLYAGRCEHKASCCFEAGFG